MNRILIIELVSALKDANGIVEHLRLTDHDGVENIDQEPLAGAQERIRAAISLSEIHAPMTETPTDALRLVPVEPTPEIIRAMCIAVENGEFMDPADPAWVDGYDAWIPSVKAAWKDALAAAPASLLPGGGEPTAEMIKVGAWRANLHREANPGDTWEDTAREVFTVMMAAAPTGDAK